MVQVTFDEPIAIRVANETHIHVLRVGDKLMLRYKPYDETKVIDEVYLVVPARVEGTDKPFGISNCLVRSHSEEPFVDLVFRGLLFPPLEYCGTFTILVTRDEISWQPLSHDWCLWAELDEVPAGERFLMSYWWRRVDRIVGFEVNELQEPDALLRYLLVCYGDLEPLLAFPIRRVLYASFDQEEIKRVWDHRYVEQKLTEYPTCYIYRLAKQPEATIALMLHYGLKGVWQYQQEGDENAPLCVG